MPRSTNPRFHPTGFVMCADCPFTNDTGRQTAQCLDWSLDECPTAETYQEAVGHAERGTSTPRRLIAFTSRINGAVKREVEA